MWSKIKENSFCFFKNISQIELYMDHLFLYLMKNTLFGTRAWKNFFFSNVRILDFGLNISLVIHYIRDLCTSIPGKCFLNKLQWFKKLACECWFQKIPFDIYKAQCKLCSTILELPNICSCLLNDNILEDCDIKHVTVSKILRFEVKFILLNSPSKVETGFSEYKILNSLIESKSALESVVLSLKEDVRNFIYMMVIR